MHSFFFPAGLARLGLQLLVLTVVLSIGRAHSSPDAEISMINVQGRETTSLNGLWEVIIDPWDAGKGEWMALYKERKPRGKTDFVEYGFASGQRLYVPGDFNSQMTELTYYEGTVWYKKTFDYEQGNKRLFVRFGAVNYRSGVYLNGELLGEHEGGFTPFQVELTDKVRPGSNSLLVRANNERIKDGIPGRAFDWFNYGGITRDVDLIETPKTYIRDYLVQLSPGSKTKISGWVQLDGPKPEQTITLSIPEAGITHRVRTDNEGRATFSVNADLELWSPQNPKLYEVALTSQSERVSENIGFRTIEVKGKDILLNGQPIFLRGVNVHEEIPQRRARAYSAADAKMLLGWAKELNSNFVRLSHYPHNEQMVRLADQMGLMIWSEVPIYQHIDFASPALAKKMDLMIREMISRDKNRSSVIIWSAANETYPSSERDRAVEKLAKLVRSLDSTRLVAQAANIFEYHDDKTIITDKQFKHFDIVAVNQYFGWYRPWPEEPGVMEWISEFDKPLIFSEFGGESLHGNDAEPRDAAHSWSEDYHERIHIDQVKMFKATEELRGVVAWILADFRSPSRMHPVYQQGWNRKGLLSDQGLRKKAWYILKDYYDELEILWEE